MATLCGVVALSSGASLATAETIIISCKFENANIKLTGNESLAATYEGDESGTVTIKASTFEFSIPAKKQNRAADGAPLIEAWEKTSSAMPDLASIESCIAKTIDPAETQDKGAYDYAATQCTRDTPPGQAVLPIMASVKILLLPVDGEVAPVVEISRYYEGKTAAPDGRTRLDTFPGACEITGK